MAEQLPNTPEPGSKSARTRQRILDAAAHALASQGYGQTSLKGVATAIGMKDASLYYYFASRDDLVLEVLRVGNALAEDAVTTALDRLGVAPDPLIALRAAIVAHATAVLGGGDYPRANVRSYGQLPPALADTRAREQRRYGNVWRGLLERAIAQGYLRSDLDPAAMRLLLLGALNWAIEWYDPTGKLSPANIGEQLAAMVLSGMQAGAQAAPSAEQVKTLPGST